MNKRDYYFHLASIVPILCRRGLRHTRTNSRTIVQRTRNHAKVTISYRQRQIHSRSSKLFLSRLQTLGSNQQ